MCSHPGSVCLRDIDSSSKLHTSASLVRPGSGHVRAERAPVDRVGSDVEPAARGRRKGARGATWSACAARCGGGVPGTCAKRGSTGVWYLSYDRPAQRLRRTRFVATDGALGDAGCRRARQSLRATAAPCHVASPCNTHQDCELVRARVCELVDRVDQGRRRASLGSARGRGQLHHVPRRQNLAGGLSML